MNDTIEMNTKTLDQFLKALTARPMVAHIGILGDKTNRKGKEPTNAEIGAKHEFGQEGMPIRSFLRMPLIDNLQKFLDKSDAFDAETLVEVIREGTLEAWLQKVAFVGEAVVLDAFATGGNGKWKPSNMALKNNPQTLIETGQLRNSISSEVVQA